MVSYNALLPEKRVIRSIYGNSKAGFRPFGASFVVSGAGSDADGAGLELNGAGPGLNGAGSKTEPKLAPQIGLLAPAVAQVPRLKWSLLHPPL